MKFLSTCVFASAMALVAVRAGAAGDAIRQFDFGAFHRCAVTGKGAVQCMGDSNVFGQVGSAELGDRPSYRPVTVIARGASKVVTGAFYSCAIAGTALQCWGDTGAAQGVSPAKPRTLIDAGVRDAAAGDDRVCAIVGDAVQCVGVGGYSGSSDYQREHPTPYTVIAHGVSAVSAGRTHACAVVDGALWCWGDVPLVTGDARQRVTRAATPVRVIEHGVSAVAVGANHDCAIVDGNGVGGSDTDSNGAAGALWCWGDNSHGQTGIGISTAHARASTQMPPQNTAATFDDGAQRCNAGYGQIECWVPRPAKVIEAGVSRVFAKFDQTCAIVTGALRCWGANSQAQLGLAAVDADVVHPTVVIERGVTDLALGSSRSCALVDGALQCTRRCLMRNDTLRCPVDAGFVAHDLAFGVSEMEARLGVWRGTLGTQEIMTCLQRAPLAESSYYYLRHRLSIALSADSADGAGWNEGPPDGTTAIWTLEPARGDRLDGQWSDSDGKRVLPIHLTRIPVSGDAAESCGRFASGAAQDAYNAPRVAAEKLSTTTAADGTRTVSALGDSVSMVELPDSTPHAAGFNAAMRAWLREQITEYYGCAFATPGAAGVDFREQREIELRAGTWLIVRESYESYCGGAHPNGGIAGYQTWNLQTGNVVEPWTWIRASKVKCDYSSDCGYAAPEKLNALIVAKADRNKNGDECADAVNENHSYLLRPSKTGLVFSTNFAHVIQACDEDIDLPYAELEAFLTATGKADLKSLVDAASDH